MKKHEMKSFELHPDSVYSVYIHRNTCMTLSSHTWVFSTFTTLALNLNNAACCNQCKHIWRWPKILERYKIREELLMQISGPTSQTGTVEVSLPHFYSLNHKWPRQTKHCTWGKVLHSKSERNNGDRSYSHVCPQVHSCWKWLKHSSGKASL